jgi:hypothetical protein
MVPLCLSCTCRRLATGDDRIGNVAACRRVLLLLLALPGMLPSQLPHDKQALRGRLRHARVRGAPCRTSPRPPGPAPHSSPALSAPWLRARPGCVQFRLHGCAAAAASCLLPLHLHGRHVRRAETPPAAAQARAPTPHSSGGAAARSGCSHGLCLSPTHCNDTPAAVVMARGSAGDSVGRETAPSGARHLCVGGETNQECGSCSGKTATTQQVSLYRRRAVWLLTLRSRPACDSCAWTFV